jgi:hypothetical protein
MSHNLDVKRLKLTDAVAGALGEDGRDGGHYVLSTTTLTRAQWGSCEDVEGAEAVSRIRVEYLCGRAEIRRRDKGIEESQFGKWRRTLDFGRGFF